MNLLFINSVPLGSIHDISTMITRHHNTHAHLFHSPVYTHIHPTLSHYNKHFSTQTTQFHPSITRLTNKIPNTNKCRDFHIANALDSTVLELISKQTHPLRTSSIRSYGKISSISKMLSPNLNTLL